MPTPGTLRNLGPVGNASPFGSSIFGASPSSTRSLYLHAKERGNVPQDVLDKMAGLASQHDASNALANGMLFFQSEHGQRMDQFQRNQSEHQRDESEHMAQFTEALVARQNDFRAHAQVGVNLTNQAMSLFMSSQHSEEDINETALKSEPSSNEPDAL